MHNFKEIIRTVLKKIYYIKLSFCSFFWALFGYITLIGFWGIGDCCYELAYIDEYKKQINKKIRIVAFKKKTEIFRFYNAVDKVSTTSEKMALYLAKFGKSYAKNSKCIVYVGHMGYSGLLPSKMKKAYGLANVNQLTYPSVKEVETDINKNSIIVNLKSNWYISEGIEAFLIELIECAQKRGIYVYVNSSLPVDLQDKSGTEEVFWDLEYFYNASNQVKSVISIRTGLLDFIVNSKANILCLYDKTKQGKWLFETFNLNSWQLDDNRINQMFVEDASPNEILNILISNL